MARQLTKKNTKVQKVIKKIVPVVNKTTASRGVAAPLPLPQVKFVEGVGRRKVATARVRVYEQPGEFIVNNQAAGQYFSGTGKAVEHYTKPLDLVGGLGKYTISVKVSGSGLASQLAAVVHGLSRALVNKNIDWKPILKQAGLLTRDDRMKETRKIGMGGKSRRQRQSPKR